VATVDSLRRILRRLGSLLPTAGNPYASAIMTVTPRDLDCASRLLFGRELRQDERSIYQEKLARRPLRFEELADELLHSAEFTTRFGRLAPVDDEIVETEVHGATVLLRRTDQMIAASVLAGVPHEPAVWAALEPLLRPDATFVDVGANVGLFALPAARCVGPGGRVVAVEPFGDNVQLLCWAVARNAFQNVDVLPFAASDRRGVIAIVTRQSTTNTYTPPDHEIRPGTPCAPMAPLDELLAGLARIDVVKIDVEGYEPAVLAGFERLLARHRPTLLVEFGPFGLDANFGVSPVGLADRLLTYAGEVAVILRDGEQVRCTSAAEIMQAWRVANQRAGLDGRMHVDVLAVGRPS
jgi:FkbM family methyltransferase